MFMIFIVILGGTVLGLSYLPLVHSACETHNTSNIQECDPLTPNNAESKFEPNGNAVVFKPTNERLCYWHMTFGPEHLIEVKPAGGNLSDSGHIFAERLINVNDCSKTILSLMKVNNLEGCQRKILQNNSINLYMQTSTQIQVQVFDSESHFQNDNDSCSGIVRTYNSFTQCEEKLFEDLEKKRGFLTCDIECPLVCTCILGDREVMSICGGDERLDTNTLLVYPYSAKFINFGNMNLTSIEADAFRSFRETPIKKLILSDNMIREFPDGLFLGLDEVYFLNVSNNCIETLQSNVFMGLNGLLHLFLEFNNISHLAKGVFNGLDNLEKLSMADNNIAILHADLFLRMINLRKIGLRNNSLESIPPGIFNKKHALDELDISLNKITRLEEGSFRGARHLSKLYLQNNNIEQIDDGVFEDTPHLATLFIYGESNTLMFANLNSFEGLTSNTSAVVQNGAICCYIQQYDAQCEFKSEKSSFLTCARLLPNQVLRVFMWILGICAFAGNILVLYWRYTRKVRENPVQSFLITNLSISDLLMGIYMLIIASADIYFGNNFPPQADQWRNGFTCKFSGFLAMVSSEASVFFVTLISIDRLFRIKYTFSRFTLQVKSSYVITSGLWGISVVIGISALVLSVVNPDLYTMSEVCIGLPLVRKKTYEIDRVKVGDKYRKVSVPLKSEPQMFFSMAIFFGLNLLCFIIVAICYLQIFITVKKSSRKAGGKSDKEVKLAIKMAVIIWTDFCCWVPICILGILAQADLISIHPTVYAWIVTFILPINSSVNPFLYTIATLSTERLRHRLSTLGDTITGMGLMRTSL